MNRHARCRAAIAGDRLDRHPRYLPGIACEVSSRILGRPAHTGTGSLHFAEAEALWNGPAAHAEFVDRMLADVAAVHRALDIDVYRIPWRISRRPARRLDAHTFLYGDPDGVHEAWRYHPGSGDYGVVAARRSPIPYQDRLAWQLEAQGPVAPVVGIDPDQAEAFRRYGGEFFVVMNGGCIQAGYDEEQLMLIASDPDMVGRLVQCQAREVIAEAEALVAAGMPRVLVGGGDLAGSQGPNYAPRSFRRIVLPVLRPMMERLRTLDVHLMFRSDGNLWPVADMLFGDGLCQGYGEIDRACTMTVAALRRRFPHLVLWGNVASADLLTRSADWIRAESRRIIDEAEGTRYFHGCSNAIQAGTPLANVEAMFAV